MDKIREARSIEERAAWDVYFAAVCSIQFHPANKLTVDQYLSTIQDAAVVADHMLEERRCR